MSLDLEPAEWTDGRRVRWVRATESVDCSDCAATGEGQHEGARCRSCRGRGHTPELAEWAVCDRCEGRCEGSLGTDEWPALCEACDAAIEAAESKAIDDEMRREREQEAV